MRRAVLVLCLLLPFLAHSQIKFTPSYLSVGNNPSPKSGYINIYGLNGMYWKYLDHFFKIDMTGNAPALAGTNDRIDIADVGYGKPMYLPFYCASVFSTMTGDFLEGTPVTGLSVVSKLQPYSYRTGDTGSKVYSLMRSGESDPVLSRIIVSSEDGDGETETSVDYAALLPVLIKSMNELKTIIETQAEEISNLEQMIEANNLTE